MIEKRYGKDVWEYHSFGMLLSGRSWELGSGYRYGFNGQEQDDEIYGGGELNSAEYWLYDTKLARRWNVDPVYRSNSSNYLVFGNNPVIYMDYYGSDWYKNNNYDPKVEGSKQYEWFEGSADHEGYTNVGEYFVKFNSATNSLTVMYQTGDVKSGGWTANINLNSDDGKKFKMLVAEGGFQEKKAFGIDKSGRGINTNEGHVHRETRYGLLVISMTIDNRRSLATIEKNGIAGDGSTFEETISEGFWGISEPAYVDFASWYKGASSSRGEAILWSFLGDCAYANWDAKNKFIKAFGVSSMTDVMAYAHDNTRTHLKNNKMIEMQASLTIPRKFSA